MCDSAHAGNARQLITLLVAAGQELAGDKSRQAKRAAGAKQLEQEMSIADQFNHVPEAGFARVGYAAQARRQFQVSLALVCILLVAAATMAISMWLDGQTGVLPGAGPVSLAASLLRLAAGS